MLVAQTWRVEQKPYSRRQRPPLDAPALRAIALRYVERYATSRAKLRAYLARKLKERGWAGDAAPEIEALTEQFAALGYVDDRAFAEARGAALTRRGFGARRVAQALQQAGIEPEDAAPVRNRARDEGFGAALRLAARRRIGPFAAMPASREQQQRAIATLVRAGHEFAVARRIAMAHPGEQFDESGGE